ncbi:MAG: 3-hydroxyacyl-CoA dehydrogenase family protein [Thermoguttaceae bacterium]
MMRKEEKLDRSLKPFVTILGAGLMGTAIAAAHLRAGIAVQLFDTNSLSLDVAPNRIGEELRLQLVSFDKSLLSVTNSLEKTVDSFIIIETITEKLRAKQKLYSSLIEAFQNKQMDSEVGISASAPFLFTNTSTIAISTLATVLPQNWKERFCGFHFFHPVRVRSLLEIIPHKYTNSETLTVAVDLANRIEKHPICVQDGPGFLVNRILNPYLTSALVLLGLGIDLKRIDRVATEFGMKMGPFRIMDEIGLDVVMHAGWVLSQAFPERVEKSTILLELIRMGRLGRKSGHGFMIYPNKTSWDGDGEIDPLWSEFFHAPKNIPSFSDDEIVRRLFLPMYEEALRCHDEHVVDQLSDADLASIHALGFPEERGGIVQWGKTMS